jgi:hypothetical protein
MKGELKKQVYGGVVMADRGAIPAMSEELPIAVEHEGKQYRCLCLPEASYGGRWEYLYQGRWHSVRNYSLKMLLNGLLQNRVAKNGRG